MQKLLNITALFSRGYKLVQTGTIDFELVKDNKIIIHFEIDSRNNTLENVYEFLSKELPYHIREIEHDSQDYFHFELVREEINYLKTTFYRELLDIRDWLV